MIRVLQVLGGLNRGGTESFIMYLYRQIDRSAIQFDFISHHPELNDYEEEISSLGGRIHYIPTFRGINYASYQQAWQTFFNQHQEYRIIHSHIWSTASIFLPIAKQHGLYTIAHAHSVTARDGIPSLGRSLFKLPLKHIPDYLIACSAAAARWVFGKNAKCTILPNAVDLEQFRFDPTVRDKMRTGNRMILGHVGTFDNNKNQSFLIDVFQRVHEKAPNTCLWLVGDGPYRKRIEEETEKLNLKDSVVFWGKRDDIHQLLQAMDVFLFPSRFESFGNVALEAQAAGLPVICSTGVPQEAAATGRVQFITTGDKARWVDSIIHLTQSKLVRDDTYNILKGSKYDAKAYAEWLSAFYIETNKRMG